MTSQTKTAELEAELAKSKRWGGWAFVGDVLHAIYISLLCWPL
jgi:hypothetical protein